jgi:hypothetical protein
VSRSSFELSASKIRALSISSTPARSVKAIVTANIQIKIIWVVPYSLLYRSADVSEGPAASHPTTALLAVRFYLLWLTLRQDGGKLLPD